MVIFFRTVNLVVRSNRDVDAVMADLGSAIRQLDPELPLTAQPLTELLGESVKPQRFSMTLVMLFAGIALTLSAIGIYGVLANAVAQQTHEIGIRVALGATGGNVMRMVFRRALMLMAAGIGIVIVGAFALTRLMSGLLYEVHPTDGIY